MPAVVEDQHAPTIERLFELPRHGRHGHLPAPTAGGDDLHVEADRISDLTGADHISESDHRREEEVVLEHPEDGAGPAGRLEHEVTVLEATGDWLLHLNVESGVEYPDRDFPVRRGGDEDVDDVGIAPQHFVELGGRPGTREKSGPPVETCLSSVTDCHDLNFIPGHIRGDHQFRDLPQPHNRQTYGSSGNRERRRS